MPPFVKGERRADENTILRAGDAVQQGCDVTVISQVIGRAPKNRNRGSGREFDGLGAVVRERDPHQLNLIVAGGDEAGNFGFQTDLGIFPN